MKLPERRGKKKKVWGFRPIPLFILSLRYFPVQLVFCASFFFAFPWLVRVVFVSRLRFGGWWGC